MADNRGPQVIVIGTGFGGAVAACRLSQAGFDVVVLERGRRYGAADFPALPDASVHLPDLARWSWGADQGLWDLQDLGELLSVQAAGYGGGSLIYANVHLRPPPSIWDDTRWPQEYRDPATLDPFYDLAAYMLDVSPVSEQPQRVPKVERLRDFARDNGHAFFEPPLSVTFEDKEHLGLDRPACTLCGGCSSGCGVGAKNSLDWNYLALAERHGAQVRTLCEVRGLEREPALQSSQNNQDGNTDSWRVTYYDHLFDRHASISAPYVFLCAGSVHSTRLLGKLRSTLPSGSLPGVGLGYYPNADAIGVAYDAEIELRPSRGPAIGASIIHHRGEPGRGDFFLLQDGGYAEELARAFGILRASVWGSRNRVTPARAHAAGGVAAMTALAAAQSATLSSPLDALLAIAADAWASAAGEQLRSPIRRWLAPGVDEVVDQTMRSWLRQRWNFPIQPPAWLKHRLLRAIVGTDQVNGIARRALQGWLSRSAKAVLRRGLSYDAHAAERRMLLLAMGRDATPGVLHYDPALDGLIADLDLFHLVPQYQRQEQLMAAVAKDMQAELRVNPFWSFLGKPITVHSQGGCRMAESPEDGAVDPAGKVHGLDGLYVLDGSILCSSVGVNPSATILAIAERNVLRFICDKRGASWPTLRADSPDFHSDGAREYLQQREAAKQWRKRAERWSLQPPSVGRASPPLDAAAVGIELRETMRGFVCVTPDDFPAPRFGRDPWVNEQVRDRYRRLEAQAHDFVELQLQLTVANLGLFIEDARHRVALTGSLCAQLPGCQRDTYRVSHGWLDLLAPPIKPYALRDLDRRAAHKRATGIEYHSRLPGDRTLETRTMSYEIGFLVDSKPWTLRGQKLLRQDPGIDAWDDSSELFVALYDGDKLVQAGIMRLGPLGFVRALLSGMQPNADPADWIGVKVLGVDERDWARKAWAIGTFASFFFGTLQRVYLPALGKGMDALLGHRDRGSRYRTPYAPEPRA